MEILFAGVGEAFDETLPNTSIIVSAESPTGRTQILLDCGFTAAHAFWRLSPAPMDLDAVWVSHFHGDHFFGLPLLLLRFWEQGRERALTILGRKGVRNRVFSAMNLAYPGFRAKIRYPLFFEEVSSDEGIDLLDFKWSFADNGHSSPCLALRLDHEKGSLFYSGDGGPTRATLALAKGCDLIVHEAYGLEKMQSGHGSVELCLDFAARTKAKGLALVHMNRDVRRLKKEEVKKRLAGVNAYKASLPEPGDRIQMEELRSSGAEK